MEPGLWKSLVLLLLHFTWVSAEDRGRSEVEKEILQKIFLSSKFNMYIRPDKIGQTDEPLEIFISMYVLNIDIDVRNKNVSGATHLILGVCNTHLMIIRRTRSRKIYYETTVQMYFRQEWNDSRLFYSDEGKIEVLSIHDATGIWTPDLFFVSEKNAYLHAITKPNVFVKIRPQGRVHYSERVTVKIACPMDLRNYPFDTQSCAIPIESYGHTANELLLKWKPDTTFGITELPGFGVSYSTTEYVVHMASNNYTRIELNIHLTRLIHPQLLHVYIPLGLLVIASWLSFCLRPSDHIPRLTTTVTITFATLIFLLSANEFFYREGYLTALDIWVGFSCLLVFAAFFENIYVISHPAGKPLTYQADGIPDKKDVPELPSGEKEKRKLMDILTGKLQGTDSNIDALARMIFPSVFVLFNVIYLAYYLI